MYAGSRKFWHEVFLPAFQKAFTVSYSELGDVGSEISFLKRRIRRLPGGLALIPGTNIDGSKGGSKAGTCAFTIHAGRCKFAT